jgi:TonB family protein
MRPIRIALPLLLLSAAACASSAGVEASASTSPAASVQLLNRAEALRLMDRYYPQLMRDARVTGEVVVRLTLNADGTVADEAVLRGTQELFSNAAITVAEQLRFSPPSLAGQQVQVRMQFALDQEANIGIVR